MFEKDVVLTLPLDKVDPDPGQPRISVNANLPKLRELGASLLAEGQHEPISCRTHPDDPERVMIVNGGRRYASSQITEGLDTIDVIVKSKYDDMTPEEIFVEQMVNNSARENLAPSEEVRSIETALNMGATIEQIARSHGKSEASIKADLPLLKLPENIRRELDSGDLSKKVAREIATFPATRMQDVYGEVKKAHGATQQVARIEAYRQKKAQTSIDVYAQAAEENAKADTKERKTLVRSFTNLQSAVKKFNISPAGNGKGPNMIHACRNKPGIAEIEFAAMDMRKIADKILENCTLYRHTTTNPEHKAV